MLFTKTFLSQPIKVMEVLELSSQVKNAKKIKCNMFCGTPCRTHQIPKEPQ